MESILSSVKKMLGLVDEYEYFDTDINDWVSIILVDSNIENDTENPTKSCTFTFEFPTPQIIS